MALNFCARTTRKLRRKGLAKKTARRFASFFYVSMMSVCGAMLLVFKRSMAGEEVNGLLRLLFGLLDGWPELLYRLNNGTGISCADARAVPVLSADFRQRR
jgi:hypothetical protein